MNSWDQQPNESSKAFERFVLYRDMGAGRSLRKLAKDLELIRRRWRKSQSGIIGVLVAMEQKIGIRNIFSLKYAGGMPYPLRYKSYAKAQ